jgi:hypothetical protein
MSRTDSVCDPDAPAQLASPAASAAWWPEHSILELGALPSAVPCVRLHTTAVLREWRLAALADAAELVASELATNAVQASSTQAEQASAGLPVVRLHLASDHRQVLVEVGDSDPRPPAPAGPDPERDGGRGLLLVEAVSARWGCYYLNPGISHAGRAPGPTLIEPGAKIVWALITP